MSSISLSAATVSSDGEKENDVATVYDDDERKTPSRYLHGGYHRDDTTSRDILLFLIAFRILNALCIKTFFQPDEFYQSLEPAWEWAFGADSGAWMTWASLLPRCVICGWFF
jgi:phosphatidylinositol glycan class B